MEKDDGQYQIGEVAKESGFSTHAIRYYEKMGLLGAPVRSEGGFRKYPKAAIEQLRFIKKAQGLGLTLAEMKQIMREREKGLSRCCSYVSKLLTRKSGELESKIRELRTMKRSLRELFQNWIPLGDAKAKKFAVCPQIEIDRKQTRGGKRHGKKKS